MHVYPLELCDNLDNTKIEISVLALSRYRFCYYRTAHTHLYALMFEETEIVYTCLIRTSSY